MDSYNHITCYICLSDKTKIRTRGYLLNADCAPLEPEGLFPNSLFR